jgi:uncharacterized membrane protein YgcG
MYEILIGLCVAFTAVSLVATLSLLNQNSARRLTDQEQTLEAVERDRIKAEEALLAEMAHLRE